MEESDLTLNSTTKTYYLHHIYFLCNVHTRLFMRWTKWLFQAGNRCCFGLACRRMMSTKSSGSQQKVALSTESKVSCWQGWRTCLVPLYSYRPASQYFEEGPLSEHSLPWMISPRMGKLHSLLSCSKALHPRLHWQPQQHRIAGCLKTVAE